MQKAFVAIATLAAPWQAEASPIAKVISMLGDLQAKVIKEGEVAQTEYAKFSEWCEDRSRNLGFEIKTATSEVESLEASLAAEAAAAASLKTKIEELAAEIASNTADLKAATTIRTKEAADFVSEEKELMDIISMLERASAILEREMHGGASMLQLKHAGNLAQALSVMVQASLIETSDAARLTAFVQQSQKAEDSDGDEAPGAPAGAVYESHSGNILDTLQTLTEKAEGLLADTRKQETTAVHNFEMLKQSLEDEIRFGSKDMDEAKEGVALSGQKAATAGGDLGVTKKDLAEGIKTKQTLHQDCMAKSQSFAAEVKSRDEELRALAAAKQAIQEATGGAALDQVSLLQVARSGLASGTDLAKFEAVRFVRDLARKQSSSALAQLASRMSSAMRSSNPFDKVKALITDMIVKLEKEAGSDATKKAYCDKELMESHEKKSDKSGEIEKLGTKIDQMMAASAKLKEEVAELESELSKLAKAQAELDKLRLEDKTTYSESKAELEKNLEGIQLGQKILSEYYATEGKAHDADEGFAGGIIGLLETIEADMSKRLAEMNADEDTEASDYVQLTNENEIEKTMKDQDLKYKAKDSVYLDKTSAELVADRTGVQAELDAVQEYLARIEEQCIAKAEAYGDRKSHREAEIAGLKQALEILESETALVQQQASRRTLRGGKLHRVGALQASA